MRIAVLASPESWYFKDLKRAAADRDELVALSFRNLSGVVESGVVSTRNTDLHTFEAVVIRTMPPGSLEQVVFRMDLLGQLEAAGQIVVNPARAVEAAVDKYLATARLAAAGLPVPRTIACQSVEEGMAAFEALGGDVVLKPLFGSEGRGIARLTDAALADRAIRLVAQLGGVLYLQEFVRHPGYDVRVLVIGRHLLAIRRTNPGDWRTNISRGAVAEPFSSPEEVMRLSRRAADVIGACVAGVDLLQGPDGHWYLIEVNAVPGWRALAAALDRDVAALVLEHVRDLVRGNVDRRR